MTPPITAPYDAVHFSARDIHTAAESAHTAWKHRSGPLTSEDAMSNTNPIPASETSPPPLFPSAQANTEAAVEHKLASLYLRMAVPPALYDGPVTQTYGRRAADDAVAAARLRQVQNLAAITAGHIEGVVLDDDPTNRQQLLAAALAHACHAATTAGITEDHIHAARELGESGVPWAHAPAHRYLGRIEQLTAELADAHTGSTVLAMVAAQSLQREHQARTEITALREQLAQPTSDPTHAPGSVEAGAPRLRAVPSPQQQPVSDSDVRLEGAGIQDAVTATDLGDRSTAWEPGVHPSGTDTSAGVRSTGQEVQP
ncbi:hypothetical protein K7711_19235 [Nocardia sp. CA2R105]|uniref:hypothetical protein n=1 Tax=Nocardia coffeae TaxID=2873381 RepID=UPI001CA77E83|nr:hypothetical protein [Nocardia coffeae]MBY8858621.1 hypothetical protein [Nocardia coffeae]